MSKFKVGDRVTMTGEGHREWGKSYDNPCGEQGTILDGWTALDCRVEWDNGSTNSYREKDLELVKETYTPQIGDRVVLTEDYDDVPAGTEGVVSYVGTHITTSRHGAHYYTVVKFGKGREKFGTYSYRYTKVEDKDFSSWVDGLTKTQMRNLKRYVEGKLNNNTVTLYSCGGRKWGKKQIPETKYKMTYTLVDGQIQDLKVENL